VPTNEEIQKRIMEALSSKMPKPICPMCQNTTWTVTDGYMVVPVSARPTKISMGPRGYPFVPVTCSKCGNTQLINLTLLGFKPEDFKDLKVSEEASEKVSQNVEH
jgi:RNase P subunit RPR2